MQAFLKAQEGNSLDIALIKT